MKVKCDFCGNYIDDSDEKCSYCGATNSGVKRTGTGVPKTIEELKQWYIDHNLPDENTTRFFIGKDYSGPRAFGIFKKDSGDFVVYKNKNDGTRITRYVGGDEEYAVSEIYLKLKEEILNQKSRNVSTRSMYDYLTDGDNHENRKSSYYTPNGYNSQINNTSASTIVIIIIVIIAICIANSIINRANYYGRHYNNSGYSSYYYDDSSSSSSYSSSSSSSSSSWWSSNDWDSSSSWDSYDSWDSDWGDWDSDW